MQFLTSSGDQHTHSRQCARIADKGVRFTFLVLPDLVLMVWLIAIYDISPWPCMIIINGVDRFGLYPYPYLVRPLSHPRGNVWFQRLSYYTLAASYSLQIAHSCP